ncbi:hypothetical protein PTTG_09773 [Puccinia triticina 1-1 BBBD Race 1]|uniref:Peptidase A2 domain-containing protein n=1 Tax=Puccinia triticina (isolate 1-1 / race 1 (BBBD)) TaxID=630390 RepID=A0A0C4F9A3_PUCT1|nr:hypothetical protein PTTG_09773 [Puccinia triticina 1-1 BBBD Race 1]
MVKIKSPNKRLCFDGTKVKRFIETYEMVASLDEATELDMARQIRLFLATDELLDILETLEGFSPPDWPKLKAAMIAYWGQVDTARFTTRDLTSLVEDWVSKGGVASATDYQKFRQSWEPIQSYLLLKAHIDSVEEIRNSYYQAFLTTAQDEIRKKLIRDGTMVTTLDHRFKLPTFKILKDAVDGVMKEQTALTFEESRSGQLVAGPSFQEGNSVMKKMGEERRSKEVSTPLKTAPNMDELSRMLEAFEHKIDQKIASIPAKSPATVDRPPMVCYYCHRENHGTGRCQELVKDKEAGLVEERGTNFFLPNGALIPFDRSRPIRHVVASFHPTQPSGAARPSTPTRQSSNAAAEYKASCGSLQPWYPPAVSSQSFAGAYEADPAGRKRHEESRHFKSPVVPPTQLKRPLRKSPGAPSDSTRLPEEDEPELFDRIMNEPETEPSPLKEQPARPSTPSKAAGQQPKVRFEREVSRDHPDAVDGLVKRIFELPVTTTVGEICSVSPAVSDGVKKWVSRRRVEVGAEDLKVNSGTLAEGIDPEGEFDPNLYSCPLGYLNCSVGEGEAISSPLVDSGSQLNLISDSLALKLNLTPRVNFSSAVYGINNQACELIGIAEDVPIRIGRSIVGTCHFWITRADGPFILGRPFLMDFRAALMFSPTSGERIILPDSNGRNIEVTLCPVDKGRWEREFPAHGRKGVLVHCGSLEEDRGDERHFL